MTAIETFLWHDYETTGVDPAADRALQFAAIRTDAELEPIGPPLNWHCQLARDVLPHPTACLITGISPQEAQRLGVCEAEFAGRIHAEMLQSQTCSVGFNNIKFDDEFTRHLLFRNLHDPYGREFRGGNSRFDLLALARLCYALRPEGLNWPFHPPVAQQVGAPGMTEPISPQVRGKPSFKLEDLARANDISHVDAHDALADVRATLELARRIRTQQRRLWDWALGLRDQREAMKLVDPRNAQPVLHSSSRYPAERACTTLVLPLAIQPERPKSVIVYDLMQDPGPLLELNAEEIADRVFTPAADLPEGVQRIALKAVHTNKVPMLAPPSVLRGGDAARIGLDPERCLQHAQQLSAHLPEVRAKLLQVFAPPSGPLDSDPDFTLYGGSFISDTDRKLLNRVLATPVAQQASASWNFQDPRLARMWFRWRARNWPHSLSQAESQAWEAERLALLTTPGTRRLDFQGFRRELADCRMERAQDGQAMALLDQLQAWAMELGLSAD